MSHHLIDDVQNRIDECETALQCIKNDSVESIMDNIGSACEALEGIESELRYCNDELEEQYEALQEFEQWGDVHDVEEKCNELDDWRALGNFEDVQSKLEADESSEGLRETLTAALESVAQKQTAIDLLEVLNKYQANVIRAARLALITDEDTGLTASQVDYMQFLRDGEPQDVVLARGVELKVNDLVDNKNGVCLCPPSVSVEDANRGPVGGPIVGWDANGSPVVEDDDEPTPPFINLGTGA